MNAKDLKNYGKSLLEMMGSVPREILEELSAVSSKILEKRLGDGKLEMFSVFLESEKERMIKKDLSALSENGINSEEFVCRQIDWAASFSAVSKIVGNQKAVQIFSEISEATFTILFHSIYPAIEEFQKVEDPFIAFKEWFLTLMIASKKIGAFDYETVENSDDAFQVNCTWCAWREIHKLLDVEDACLPYCHADDVFFPNYCKQIGVKYKRENTLVRVGRYCDYRFER